MRLPNEVPDAVEFGIQRAYLARMGVSQADIKKFHTDLPGGSTRAEITASLQSMCQQFPKAS